MNTKSERFEMRLDPEIIERVDTWRSEQMDIPSRAEAIRRLTEYGLSAYQSHPVKLDDGSKLILVMLSELYEKMNVKGEIEPSFIKSVIYDGQYWALKWQYPGIFYRYDEKERVVSEVVDIFDMWSFLESSYEKLSNKDKALIKKETDYDSISFPGFDGNNEIDFYGVARFLIDDLGRFESFKGRYLNSHSPSLEGYRRMLRVFLPMRPSLTGGKMNAGQIIQVMKAKWFSAN